MTAVDRIRELSARYWQPVVSLAAAVPGLLNALGEIYQPLSQWPAVAATPQGRWTFVAIAVALLILVRYPRLAFLVTRLLLGAPPPPPRPTRRIFLGPQSFNEDDAATFFGREQDAADCLRHITKHHFTVIEGESGSGKSSLVNAALIPVLRNSYNVVLCRLGGDPLRRLWEALHGGTVPIDSERLAQELSLAVNEPRRPSDTERDTKPRLLVVDQFEEIFVTAPDTTRRRVAELLRDGIASGSFVAIIVTRSDFMDLVLRFCRDADPLQQHLDTSSYYPIAPFDSAQARDVLQRMLVPLRTDDPLGNERLGDFIEELVHDLLRPPRDKRLSREDVPTVLPVELQTVGSTIELLGPDAFSRESLVRVGRKAGLYRLYMESVKTYVYRKTAVPGDSALLLLRKLISPASTKWTVTVGRIAAEIGYTPQAVTAVLNAFADRYLVRRVPPATSGDPADDAFELMHEHLVQVLNEAPDPVLQKARDADERLAFWFERTQSLRSAEGDTAGLLARLRQGWSQPIPTLETLRLWKYADAEEKRLLRTSLRGFIVRVATICIAGLATVGGWMLFERTDRSAVKYMVRTAPVAQLQDIQGGDGLLVAWVRALSYVEDEDIAGASIHLLKDSDDRVSAWVFLAEAAARRSRPAEARKWIEVALAQPDPNLASAKTLVGATIAFRSIIQSGEASDLSTLLQTTKVPLARARAAQVAIAAAAEVGDQRAVGTALQVALDTLAAIPRPADSDFSVYTSVFETCWKRQLIPDAKRVLAAMTAKLDAIEDKEDGKWYRITAELHSRFGDWDAVVAALREGVRRGSGVVNPEPLLVAAYRLPSGALPTLRAIVATLKPGDPYSRTLHAVLFLRRDTPDLAGAQPPKLGTDVLLTLIESVRKGDIPKTDAIRDVVEAEYRDPDATKTYRPDARIYWVDEMARLSQELLEIGWADLALTVARASRPSAQGSLSNYSPRFEALISLIDQVQHEPTAADLADLGANERNMLLARVAAVLIARGSFEKASTFASRIEHFQRTPFDEIIGRTGRDFDPSLTLARAWATDGDAARALEAARRESSDSRRERIMADVAVIFAEPSRLSDADKAIALITTDYVVSATRAAVISKLARNGHVAIAEQRLTDVQYPDDQARAIAAVAMEKAESDGLYAATRMAERCASVKYRMQAYTSIMLTYAARAMPEHAEATATLQQQLRGDSGS